MNTHASQHDQHDQPSDTSMRAVVQTRYGGPSTWTVGSIDRPRIGSDEVLVEVRAAAIDRGTWHLMTGTPYLARLAFGIRRPRRAVPGLDLAGVVLDIGRDVTRFGVGDEVFGIGRGSLAEECAAREVKLAPKPTGLSFEHAAAMGVSGLTALQALCDVGRLQAGHRVLVTGASGGVGTFAVQIAVAHGAIVTGVCSPAKADLVASLGAHGVIDRTRCDLATIDERYDLIVDTVGTLPLRHIRRLLTARGTLVIVGNATGGRWLGGLDRQARALLWSPMTRRRMTSFVSREHHRDLERLAELTTQGHLVPSLGGCWSLDEAAEAMRRLDAGLARGKLVVVPRVDQDSGVAPPDRSSARSLIPNASASASTF